MKINKIMTVLLGFMLISMIGMGAVIAGVFPNPFVINGNEDVDIIYGANGDDLSGANSIGNNLIATWTSQQPIVVDDDAQTTIVIGDESFLIQSHGNDLNLFEPISDVDAKLTEDDLPIILAEGSVEKDNGDEVDYTQELLLKGNEVKFASLDADEYIVNEDYASNELPLLYLDMSNPIWELIVDFDESIDVTRGGLEDNSKITIAGIEYTIDPNLAYNDDLTLYGSTQELTINLQETKVITLDGEQVSITVSGADPDDDEVLLIVDGAYETVGEGDVFTVNGERIYVNEIHIRTIPDNTVSIELFIGADEIVIDRSINYNAVEVNGKDVDGMEAKLNDADLRNLETISFKFTPSDLDDDDEEGLNILEMGESIIDPLFRTIAMTFKDIDTEALDSEDDRELVEVKSYSDELELSFTNIEGDEITFIAYIENSGLKPNFKTTLTGLNEDDEFIAQISGDITDVFRIEDINSGDVEIYSYAEDNTETYEVGDEIEGTGITVDVIGPTINLGGIGSDYVTTKNEMKIMFGLVVADEATITFDESGMDKDEISTTDARVEVKVRLDTDGDIEMTDIISADITKDSDDDGDIEYSITNGFGTYFVRNDDTDRILEVYIPETETDMNVYISAGVEKVVVDTNDTDGNETTTDTTIPGISLSDIVLADNSADLTENNLVVVGGSCINQVAAKLLGSDTPVCGEDFTALTGVSEGQYMIKTFVSPYNADKIAVLVVGYTKADTQNGVDALLVEGFTLPNVGEQFIV